MEDEANPSDDLRPLYWPNESIWILPRLRGDIVRQLKARPPACMSSWEKYPDIDSTLRDGVDSLIREYFRWPNTLFLPNDPISILLYDPWGELLDVEVLLKIDDLGYSAVDAELRGTYAEFLRSLVPTPK